MQNENPNDISNGNAAQPSSTSNNGNSRRDFLHTGSTLAVAGAAFGTLATPGLALARSANVAGRDTIKIGLVGAGGRGTGAVTQAMNTSSANIELTAIGDAFENRLNSSLQGIKAEGHQDKVRVTDANKFTGFDAYKGVMDSDADLVILATPPGFRPLHFEAAIAAGKHVFMEKPVAVDAPGVRRVLAAGELAKQKGLLVQVGLQRRHERAYRETIAELQNGAIGDLICSRVYWNNPGVWVNPRTPEQSELEYQMRNWYYFNWICGDHIVEQHIHNIDVINWLMEDYPKEAQGTGGRLVRTGPEHGQIFDHHSVEFTYANGHKMFSMCRHMPGCWSQVSEYVHGSKGYADISGGKIFDADGKRIFQTKAGRDGHQQEHHDLFADLVAGKLPNETEYGAKSTMTSIFGRLATYTGKKLNWDKAINSKISLADVDSMHGMSDEAPVQLQKNGQYPIPVPGTGADAIIDF